MGALSGQGCRNYVKKVLEYEQDKSCFMYSIFVGLNRNLPCRRREPLAARNADKRFLGAKQLIG